MSPVTHESAYVAKTESPVKKWEENFNFNKEHFPQRKKELKKKGGACFQDVQCK